MSEDGADLGIKPTRALETIFGKEQPKKEEELSKEKMRQEILAQPDEYEKVEDTYDANTMWLAKQFLKMLEEGIKEDMDFLYDEMKKRNGERNYGYTGFMVGWANNAARYCLDKPPQSNPAIVTIGREEK